ncbi:Heptaprenyl diphosphate synthase component 2 [subsurface metagenome]
MAFQIIDDSLDFNGDTTVTGKPQFMDLMTDRITLPVIHSLKGFTTDEKEALLSGNGESIEKLVEIVRNNGGVEYAYDIAHGYSKKAFELLNGFNNKNASDRFEDFITVLLKRLY